MENRIVDLVVNSEMIQARLLNAIEVEGKRYAIFAKESDNKEADLFATYIEQDEDGYDVFTDITSEEDLQTIKEVIEDILD